MSLAKLAPVLTLQAYARHCDWMNRALRLAQEAGDAGDVPVGAIVVGPRGEWVAEASNRKHQDQDPAAHGELLALRRASQHFRSWHLGQCTLYVTLEPCPMCAGAMIHARLGLLVYGAPDPKTGAIHTVLNLPHSPASNYSLTAIAGIREAACRELLQGWFAQRRSNSHFDFKPNF